jgi:hypothetical protein
MRLKFQKKNVDRAAHALLIFPSSHTTHEPVGIAAYPPVIKHCHGKFPRTLKFNGKTIYAGSAGMGASCKLIIPFHPVSLLRIPLWGFYQLSSWPKVVYIWYLKQ